MQTGEAILKYKPGTHSEGPGGQDVRGASSVGHFSNQMMAAPHSLSYFSAVIQIISPGSYNWVSYNLPFSPFE